MSAGRDNIVQLFVLKQYSKAVYFGTVESRSRRALTHEDGDDVDNLPSQYLPSKRIVIIV